MAASGVHLARSFSQSCTGSFCSTACGLEAQLMPVSPLPMWLAEAPPPDWWFTSTTFYTHREKER